MHPTDAPTPSATGATGPLQPRSLIRESWGRCQALHVDAGRRLASILDETKLRLWHCQDARNYIILGDPAVRLATLEPLP